MTLQSQLEALLTQLGRETAGFLHYRDGLSFQESDLDSRAFLTLLVALEESLGVQLEPDDITGDNFKDCEALTRKLCSLVDYGDAR